MIYKVRAKHEDGDKVEFLVLGKDERECLERAQTKAQAIFKCVSSKVSVELAMKEEKGDPSQRKMPFVEQGCDVGISRRPFKEK